MNERNERADSSEPSVNDLLNQAIAWLQYSRGVTAMLADLVHEAEGLDSKQLGLSLEAIAAMTQAGVEQVGQAHAKWTWEQRQAAALA
ncbi:hypothetical protein [Luteibacter aegosomatissinici]|uniref:hypothetical protein n=1 Tax=Luteibacter aegosomatissinici TaxID=2911539 RepID=UPI001FFA57C7|nr:hypothetical protein [Luteibacter aegosomatissinici]UPG94314.1 hypothetical protein L2Y97_21275 [Luteibacter aegosomatissinici]